MNSYINEVQGQVVRWRWDYLRIKGAVNCKAVEMALFVNHASELSGRVAVEAE